MRKLALITASASMLTLVGCATNPSPPEATFLLLPTEQVAQLDSHRLWHELHDTEYGVRLQAPEQPDQGGSDLEIDGEAIAGL